MFGKPDLQALPVLGDERAALEGAVFVGLPPLVTHHVAAGAAGPEVPEVVLASELLGDDVVHGSEGYALDGFVLRSVLQGRAAPVAGFAEVFEELIKLVFSLFSVHRHWLAFPVDWIRLWTGSDVACTLYGTSRCLGLGAGGAGAVSSPRVPSGSRS